MPAKELLKLAAAMARGRQAMALGHSKEAAARFSEAAAIEDGIPYQEPPYWYHPVRQSLGAAQFALGDYAGAQASFKSALTRWPGNGWALYGLAQSERALRRRVEAAAAEEALKRAWLGDPAWLRMERL